MGKKKYNQWLSNKLKDESIVYLQNFLKKKRPRPLPKKVIDTVNKWIIEKKKDNSKLAEEIINSALWNLAWEQLKNLRAIERIDVGGGKYREYADPRDVLLVMNKILETANETEKKEELQNYMQGVDYVKEV